MQRGSGVVLLMVVTVHIGGGVLLARLQRAGGGRRPLSAVSPHLLDVVLFPEEWLRPATRRAAAPVGTKPNATSERPVPTMAGERTERGTVDTSAVAAPPAIPSAAIIRFHPSASWGRVQPPTPSILTRLPPHPDCSNGSFRCFSNELQWTMDSAITHIMLCAPSTPIILRLRDCAAVNAMDPSESLAVRPGERPGEAPIPTTP